MAFMKLRPTGLDVATFLGRQGDTVFVAQCTNILTLVTPMAASYTRDVGFESATHVPDDIFAAIVSKAARWANNPLSLNTDSVDTTTMQDNYAAGWNPGERMILNRYRVRSQ